MERKCGQIKGLPCCPVCHKYVEQVLDFQKDSEVYALPVGSDIQKKVNISTDERIVRLTWPEEMNCERSRAQDFFQGTPCLSSYGL